MSYPIIERVREVSRTSSLLEEGEIAHAEMLMGRDLPPFLRALYSSCGNGGFGVGVRPLIDEDDPASIECSIGYWRAQLEETGPHRVPRGLFPFFEWGCGLESLVDLDDAALRVVRFDPHWDIDASTIEAAGPRPACHPSQLGPNQWPCYRLEAPSLEGWLALALETRPGAQLQSMQPQARMWPEIMWNRTTMRMPNDGEHGEGEAKRVVLQRLLPERPIRRVVNPFTKGTVITKRIAARAETIRFVQRGAIVRTGYGVVNLESRAVEDVEENGVAFESTTHAAAYVAEGVSALRKDGYVLEVD